MGLWNSLSGVIKVEIVCASPAQLINKASDAGIVLEKIQYQDELKIQCWVARHKYGELTELVSSSGGSVRRIKKVGLFFDVTALLKRPVFLWVVAMLFAMSVFLPTRVLFIRVDGNSMIPDALILENAEQCGVAFGALRRDVRSEQVKNFLLSKLPQLQWVGVNTSGCVATISVRERSNVTENITQNIVGSIVADRDGILREMTVHKGTALCSVGQAVKKGQVLVSGYTDCGIYIRAEMAEAEILAQTSHNLKLISPVDFALRGEILKKEKKYSIQIGKKLIKLYKDSGIPDVTCVKMYTKKQLALPGGFYLPFVFVTEEYEYHCVDESSAVDADACVWMEKAADQYLRSQMVGGKILQAEYTRVLDGNLCRQDADYACLEMIGQVRDEEIYQINGTRD